MTKSVRIPEGLALEIASRARVEKRSFANMVVVLLERSLGPAGSVRIPVSADAQARTAEARKIRPAAPVLGEVTPDFKGGKR